MEHHHWTPDQIGRMTFYQVFVALGRRPKSDDEMTIEEYEYRLKKYSGE